MQTLLTLRRLSPQGHLLEQRRQLSRSFVRNFIELLYVNMTQAGVTISDVFGQSRSVSVGYSNLVTAAPPARGLGGGYIPGDLLGIQVGSGNTPPTPADVALEARIPHVDGAIEAGDVFKEGFYYPSVTSSTQLYGNNWAAAVFMVGQAVRAYKARIRGLRLGSVAGRTLTLGIRAVAAGTYLPTGADIIAGTLALDDTITTVQPGQWLEVTFGGQTTLHPGLADCPGALYALVGRIDGGDGSNYLRWRYYTSGSDGSYTRYREGQYTRYCTSGNGGSSWTDSDYHQMEFQILGRYPPGLLYGGSSLELIEEPAVPPPDQRFTMRRYFSNVCGQAVTVSEIGLHIMAYSTSYYPHLAARDVLGAPVVVNSGEILEVIYQPQINV